MTSAAAVDPSPTESEAAPHDLLEAVAGETLRPAEVVRRLDEYIIGQHEAKRSVAIALRNRVRRRMLPEDMRNEVLPKNILMIGPTGVGKTEIARRVSRLTESPFIKVEATKFTEVGYVGRDVESILRDLLEQTITELHEDRVAEVEPRAQSARRRPSRRDVARGERASARGAGASRRERAGTRVRPRLRHAAVVPGAAGSRAVWPPAPWRTPPVEIEVEEPFQPAFEGFTGTGLEEVGVSLSDFFSQLAPPRKRKKLMTVAEARDVLIDEETDRLIDMDRVYDDAIHLVEDSGVVFIDEVDKICGPGIRPRARRQRRGGAARPAPDPRGRRRCTPATGRCAPTTSCSSPPARSPRPGPATSSPSSRAGFPSASS